MRPLLLIYPIIVRVASHVLPYASFMQLLPALMRKFFIGQRSMLQNVTGVAFVCKLVISSITSVKTVLLLVLPHRHTIKKFCCLQRVEAFFRLCRSGSCRMVAMFAELFGEMV